ncbi:MAG: DNA adenine methylase [Candidatus Aenigmarchaeota archaeon]|nr:DNA adenine methylase [Candidatus Aenigmarchaeota archaeon]
MKPLIKWAGGKSNEIKNIIEIIPKFDRYIEPFFGGGALFFYLEPKKAIVNDVSNELIMFYCSLKNEEQRASFRREIEKYVKFWDRINDYMSKFGNSFITLYEKYRYDKINDAKFESEIKNLFREKIVPFNGLFSEKFCLNQTSLLEKIEKNLITKLRRVKHKIDVKNGFSRDMIIKNIETAFRSGFYIHFRDIMNKSKRGYITIDDAKKIANYYFVREFCYGSMFRFNSDGDFNIPYGGIAYNTKDFRRKVGNLLSDKVRRLFENTVIDNMDFEKFLRKHKPKPNDFIFFDPPYDTEFSGYEENPFNKKDQERLAECILDIPSKFILIIKETDFIRKLYDNKNFQDRGVKIVSFGKKYAYNVKGRNERDVTHLIIHNLNPNNVSLNKFF